ncbi:hypothetical protein SRHO_G00098440 [Serrasalmus rhombeus]
MADEESEERPLVAEQGERARRKRQTIRTSTTRLINQIDVELQKEDEQRDLNRVREMLAVLLAKEDSLRELDNIVEEHTSLEDVEAEIELAEEYRDCVIEIKTRAHRVISETVSNPLPTRQSDASSANKQTVRLPKLQIDKFNRDVSSWQEFWSQYKTAIHNNSALCKKEKFTYLKTYLTGTAANAEHKSEKCPDHDVPARKGKLKKLGRCFVCLGSKHIAKFCKTKGMSCATCGGRHHAAVCEKNLAPPPDVSTNTDTLITSVIPQAEKAENTVLLQTAKAWAIGPTSRKMVCCLLDGGSQGSFVHKNVVKELQLPVTRQGTLTLHTFGSSTPTTVSRNIVKLSMENVWDKQQRIEIEAVVTPQVCTALMKVPGEHIQKEMKRRGLQLADCDGDYKPELSVLIGSDYYWQIVSGRVERLTKSLVALESTFGWAVQGPMAVSSMTESTCMNILLCNDAQMDKQLHAFWELESLGITSEKPESPEDAEAL